MRNAGILISPKITEKAIDSTKQSIYTFEVARYATKTQIKDAVQTLYNVKVSSIKTVIKKGKTKKTGRRLVKKALPHKKMAYIKLLSGKINLFPQQ